MFADLCLRINIYCRKNYAFVKKALFVYYEKGDIGEYDPAEIHNAGQLKKHMVFVCVHLAWQMVSFFLYLYWSEAVCRLTS